MSIIYPPRPKGAVPPSQLPHFEGLGTHCIQPKYNGSRAVVNVSPQGKVSIWSRHGRSHLNYTMPLTIQNEILAIPGLPKGVEVCLDCELLNKTTATDTKGKFVLFDVLHYGKYLFCSLDQVERIDLLNKICGYPSKLDPWRGMGYYVSENILMAPTFYSAFKEEFDKHTSDEVEGVVLRKKNSVIDNFGQKEYEVSWLIRCRRAHKNYSF
jgi:ATP-dependent DNA ligase